VLVGSVRNSISITPILLLLQVINYRSNTVKHLWFIDEFTATLGTWFGMYCSWLFSN